VATGNTLNIQTNRNHSGRYWCLAENGLDKTVNASAYLNVQCECEMRKFALVSWWGFHIKALRWLNNSYWPSLRSVLWVTDRVFFPHQLMTQARSARTINRRGKTGICNLHMNYISTVCLTGSGAISIHAEWLQISDAPLKQKGSIWNRC